MVTEIINIGDELLIGQVVNTNASWMAEQMNFAGFSIRQITVIQDEHDHILKALSDAEKRASIVLISGGIGPTGDDITKQTLCEFFNTTLAYNEDAFRDYEERFRLRGMPVTDQDRKQAELPVNCLSIPNKLGTARGMWFEKMGTDGRKTIFISMPGVPYEMKAMMTGDIIPKLKQKYRTQAICHKTILTQGVGESYLAAKISSWEAELPAIIKLAYLPQPSIVRLRMTASGKDEKELVRIIDQEVLKLNNLIPEYIFGYDDDTLEEIVGKLLKTKSATIGTAESCTGGYIAHLLTSVPGSSDYFKGSVIAYANEIKQKMLGVDEKSLNTYGAVSEQVVKEMAAGIKKSFGVDYAIAVTGIAGPDGGTDGKPVGSTWIAVATPEQIIANHFLFGEGRERNIRKSALQALNMLRKNILKAQ